MSATAQRREPRVPLTAAPEPGQMAAEPQATLQLDAAVLKVQRLAPKLVRDATGQVQSRTYGYVTLTSVMDVVLPLLVDEQLVWKTFPTTLESGAPGLRYRMSHLPSGEFDEDIMPLPCDPTMQGLGSGITYGRRYALTSYLQLTVDEDDDGASANQVRTIGDGVPTDRATADTQPTAKAPKKSERRVTEGRKGLLRTVQQERGIPADVLANIIIVAAGEEPRQWSSDDAAENTLGRMIDQMPARLFDEVLTAAKNESKR